MFAHLEYIERHLCGIESDIDEAVAEHVEAFQFLSSIPGVSKISASAIIAEIGTDMTAFPTSQHICSWAGLSPGNNSSAWKNKSPRAKPPYLKSILCEVGWATARLRACSFPTGTGSSNNAGEANAPSLQRPEKLLVLSI